MHGLPSSTLGLEPPAQAPLPLHVSAPLHAFASEHDVPTATGSCATPLDGLHESAVQGLPSSTVGLDPATHAPAALHVSAPLHAFASEHDVPTATGSCATPPDGRHESAVQGLPSSTAGAVPATQLPVPLHVSAPLHVLPSAQAVPAATEVWATPLDGSQESAVHGLPSSTVGLLPATQVPLPLHVSAPLHASLSPASGAGAYRNMRDTTRRTARVGRTWITIIDGGARSGNTTAATITRLRAVTRVTVGARSARGHCGVDYAANWAARIRGARVAVIDGGARSGNTTAATITRLRAVTRVTVRAGGAGADRGVYDALNGITTVGGAHIAVVD